MQQPVYPKENHEHRKLVMEEFYRRVRITKWDDEPRKPSIYRKNKKSHEKTNTNSRSNRC